MNVRFSSVFSVSFVGPQRESKPQQPAWSHWEPPREPVHDNDRMSAANNLNHQWAKEGRKAVLIYQLNERDLIPGAHQRSQPYFYMDGDDYDTFMKHHDREFPPHQQDELAADWNRGEWSKRFLRICQALADRLIVNHSNEMKIEVSRWSRPVILHDPSVPVPKPETRVIPSSTITEDVGPATLPFDPMIASSGAEATTPVSNPAQQKPSATSNTGAFIPTDSSPTAA